MPQGWYVHRFYEMAGDKEAAHSFENLQAAHTTNFFVIVKAKSTSNDNIKWKESRDFVPQVIVIVDQNATVIADVGYDPASRSEQLKTKL